MELQVDSTTVLIQKLSRMDTHIWKVDCVELYEVMLLLEDGDFGLILSLLLGAMDEMNPNSKHTAPYLMKHWHNGHITFEELISIIFKQFYQGYKFYLRFKNMYNFELVQVALDYLYAYYCGSNFDDYILSFSAEEVYDVVYKLTRRRLTKFQVHMGVHTLIRHSEIKLVSRGNYSFAGKFAVSY